MPTGTESVVSVSLSSGMLVSEKRHQDNKKILYWTSSIKHIEGADVGLSIIYLDVLWVARYKQDPFSEKHFRWSSIRRFIILSNTFANSFFTFDLFSKTSLKRPIRIFEYVFAQIFLGMGYLFMDSFIRQYTRKIDGYKFLNPLLSGVGYGQILQTALSCLIASSGTADAMRFLTGVLKKELPWTVCTSENTACVPVSIILDRCNEGKKTDLNVTSVQFYYADSFIVLDRNAISTKTFVMSVIWMCNFTVATLSDDNVLKFFKLLFIFKTLSTIVVALVLVMFLRRFVVQAFSELMVLEVEWSISGTISHMSYVYGVGFVPFYDFGAISPFTMVDTAIIFSSVYFTVFAFLRSWIIQMIHLNLLRCIRLPSSGYSHHVLLFCVLPLGAELLRAQKLYLYFFFMNIIASTFSHVVITTISVAKILQSEFRSVKLVYFTGVISCVGFILAVPAALAMNRPEIKTSLSFGLSISLLYLGSLKTMVVMWIYGLERFCTDINYWLGFKPTMFWKLTWAVTPIVLVIAIFRIARKLVQEEVSDRDKILIVWVAITILTVAFFNIKTAIKFLVRNNLAGVFEASIKYGPPDPVDRRNRRNYNETVALRRCKHNCQVVDDLFECNHKPIMFKSFSLQSPNSSNDSLMSIYHAEERKSSTPNLLHHQNQRGN